MTVQRVIAFLAFSALAVGPLRGQDADDLDDPVGTIDRILAATWQSEGVEPSEPATEAALQRRMWLDVAGVVPSRRDTLAYLESDRPDKADRLAAALLERPDYARHQALVWQDILIGQAARSRGDTRLFRWLEIQFETNRPYDELARDLLTARGPMPLNFSPNQLARVAASYEDRALDVGPSPVQYMSQYASNNAGYIPAAAVGGTMKVFMGMRIECAECHDHPWEAWSQKDFQGMEAFFKQTAVRRVPGPGYVVNEGTPREQRWNLGFLGDAPMEGGNGRDQQFRMMMSGDTPPALQRIDDRIARIEEDLDGDDLDRRDRTRAERELERLRDTRQKALERFEEARKRLMANPNLKDLVEAQEYEPRFLVGGIDVDTEQVSAEELRQNYATIMLSNPEDQFARAIANRMWAAYFGRGIVHPVDDMRESNPPAIPALLDFLTRLIVHLDYDLKAFAEILMRTRAYRLGSIANESNIDDEIFFSRRIMVPLTPEQTAFSLLRVRSESTYDRLDEGYEVLGRFVRQFVVALDNEEGTEVSEFSGTIPKSLFMMNSEAINGLPDLDIDPAADPLVVVEDLYLSILGRRPGDEERFVIGNHLAGTDPLEPGWERRLGRRPDPETLPPRIQAIQDVYWALLNSAEFSYNH